MVDLIYYYNESHVAIIYTDGRVEHVRSMSGCAVEMALDWTLITEVTEVTEVTKVIL